MTQINNYLPIFNNFKIPVVPAFRSTSYSENVQLTPKNDSFVTSPLNNAFPDKERIESIARSNPRIQSILKEHNLPLKVNEKTLLELKKGHLSGTRILSAQIASNLPAELKSEVDMKSLQEASMYHDIGKVFIPDEILNKKGSLTDSEWEIMKLHSELGYEIAKSMGLSDKTSELILYHHQNESGTGYPAIKYNYQPDVNAEILCAADEYSALSEERSYKKALTKEETLSVMSDAVEKGLISKETFESLKKSV